MEDNLEYDVSGFEEVRNALLDLINDYPALGEGDSIAYATLNGERGKALFTLSSPVIESERRSIVGHVYQKCYYPFVVVYRASGLKETSRKAVGKWLDDLGRWLEQKEVVIGDETYTLEEYPTLSGKRKISTIQRNSPAILSSINEDNSENWTVDMVLKYDYEFDI